MQDVSCKKLRVTDKLELLFLGLRQGKSTAEDSDLFLILNDGREIFEELNKELIIYDFGITRFSQNLKFRFETLKVIMLLDENIDTLHVSLYHS